MEFMQMSQKTPPSEPSSTPPRDEPSLKGMLQLRPNIPTLWADRVALSLKTAKGTGAEIAVVVSFFQEFPPLDDEQGPAVEMSRMAVSFGTARSFLDILAKHLGYTLTKNEEGAA